MAIEKDPTYSPLHELKTSGYKSPLNKVNPENIRAFTNIESFEGSVKEVFDIIDGGITNIENGTLTDRQALTLFYRTYEVIKMTIEEKINISRGKEDTKDAIDSIEDALDLAIACDLRSASARDVFNRLKERVETTSLKTMLSKKLKESPDFNIMPERPGDKDRQLARNLLNRTHEKDILAIAIAHRGVRRAIDIFLHYCYEAESEGSQIWAVRHSPGQGDIFNPVLCWQEAEKLKEMSVGKQVVVIGPQERIQLASDFLKQIAPKNQIILKVPLAVSETTDKDIKTGFRRRGQIVAEK